MDKSLIMGAVLGSAMAAGGGASMQYLAQAQPVPALESAVVQGSVIPAAAPPAQMRPVARPSMAPRPAQQPVYVPPAPRFARVLEVSPVRETVSTPRQSCVDVPVEQPAPAKDRHQIAGIVGGALLGGLLGRQVGDGRGKDLATVAGAAAGAFGGRSVQREVQQGRRAVVMEQRCETVLESQEHISAYDVRYTIDGEVATVRMAYDPGEQIPLANGSLVI